MRVVVLHNAISPDASTAERDVLFQVEVVVESLRRLGHDALALPASLNLEAVAQRLGELAPAAVFNLVESVAGSDWLSFLATGLLDALRLPYTGSPTEAMFLSAHKLLAKERLCQAGLPTPAWIARDDQPDDQALPDHGRLPARLDLPWILKSISEHASFGLDEDSIIHAAPAAVRDRLRQQTEAWGCEFFAEQYVDGREFNIAMLTGPGGPQILPPAEIDFSVFPAGKAHVVGHRAKWEEASFEYGNTPRRFDFADADRPLLDELQRISHRCWRAFRLRGYVRVDFRVDSLMQPWVLEINTNPCLSPDAGFAAALQRAGVGFDQAVARILDDALTMRPASGNHLRGGTTITA
jgi:D-alanine-D-alanine ligase